MAFKPSCPSTHGSLNLAFYYIYNLYTYVWVFIYAYMHMSPLLIMTVVCQAHRPSPPDPLPLPPDHPCPHDNPKLHSPHSPQPTALDLTCFLAWNSLHNLIGIFCACFCFSRLYRWIWHVLSLSVPCQEFAHAAPASLCVRIQIMLKPLVPPTATQTHTHPDNRICTCLHKALAYNYIYMYTIPTCL